VAASGLKGAWGLCAASTVTRPMQDFSTILLKPAVDNNHAFFRRIPGMLAVADPHLGIRSRRNTCRLLLATRSSQSIQLERTKIEPRLGVGLGSNGHGKMKSSAATACVTT